jgi:hypothetical protein
MQFSGQVQPFSFATLGQPPLRLGELGLHAPALGDLGGVDRWRGSLGNKTLLQALNFKGRSTLSGAEEILLRAAVAALLNSASAGVDYQLTTAQVIAEVNAALAPRCNRGVNPIT